MSHASADRNFLQFKEMTTNMNTYVPKDEIFLQMFFALKSIPTQSKVSFVRCITHSQHQHCEMRSLDLTWLTTIQFVELVTAATSLRSSVGVHAQWPIQLYTATSEAVFWRAESLPKTLLFRQDQHGLQKTLPTAL